MPVKAVAGEVCERESCDMVVVAVEFMPEWLASSDGAVPHSVGDCVEVDPDKL